MKALRRLLPDVVTKPPCAALIMSHGGERHGGVFFAWGWGDQFIFVLPAYEMVVVTTAGNYDVEGNPPMDFLRSHILPAIRDAERAPAGALAAAH